MRGPIQVYRGSGAFTIPYSDPTPQHVGVGPPSLDALRIEPLGFETVSYARCWLWTSENAPSETVWKIGMDSIVH